MSQQVSPSDSGKASFFLDNVSQYSHSVDSLSGEEMSFMTLGKSTSPDRHLGVTLTWRDLSVYVPNPDKTQSNAPFKRVLNNVCGALQPGCLVALMGASGAGKSTLLNALAHRSPPSTTVDGDIRVNGRPIGRYFCDWSGYVYQDDLFVGSLTPKEHLHFMARLRINGNLTPSQRDKRVNELLRELGLYRCRNTPIGIPGVSKSLSGGEQKRLAFAAEVLTDPPIFFCDEPTTGLDAYSALRLVLMLKDLVRKGKTVVCTIHQPSSEVFELFDQVVLLAEGRIAYQGPTNGALNFFETFGYKCPPHYNPADFYVQTLAVIPGLEETSRTTIRAICDAFAVTPTAQQINLLIQYESRLGDNLDPNSSAEFRKQMDTRKSSWMAQFIWLTWRSFLDSYRNPAVHFMRILQKIAIAALVGFCYYGLIDYDQRGIQNIQGALFIMTTENTFPALYGTLNIFPSEWPLFVRESRGGLYSTSAYYFSKVLALLPGFLLEPWIFVSIAYWLIGLNPDWTSFFYTMVILTLTCNTAAACGTFFSAAFESIPKAISVLIPFDYLLFITGGVFISLDMLPSYASWAKYLSWFLYTNEALTIVQWKNVSRIECGDLPDNIECIQNGREVLDHYRFDSSHFPIDLSAMMITYIVFHVLAFLALYRRARK